MGTSRDYSGDEDGGATVIPKINMDAASFTVYDLAVALNNIIDHLNEPEKENIREMNRLIKDEDRTCWG